MRRPRDRIISYPGFDIGGGSIALLASLPDNQVEAIIVANAPRYKIFKKKAP